MSEILHICNGDKFTGQFVELMNSEVTHGTHVYFVAEREVKYPIINDGNVIFLRDFPSRLHGLIELVRHMNAASVIVLHGLFGVILYILFVQPWLLKKVRWVIWGGDLYVHLKTRHTFRHKLDEWIRHKVIPYIGYMQYWIEGDVELARKWYGARGEYIQCLMYPSNTFDPIDLPKIQKDHLTVLVGNSADPTNNHREVFEQLKAIDDGSLQVVCPLSYGDSSYAKEIVLLGYDFFGDRFSALEKFMLLEDYRWMLANVDIAIFAHHRQQGMGNTISLLGLGKKVYMRDDVTPWITFKKMGLRVFSLRDLNLIPLGQEDAEKNKAIVAREFSRRVLVRQLNEIFKSTVET